MPLDQPLNTLQLSRMRRRHWRAPWLVRLVLGTIAWVLIIAVGLWLI
jgi:hypothetical protein